MFAVGIALLFVGVLTEWYVGIAGFVLMLGSATLALSTVRSRQAAACRPPRRHRSTPRASPPSTAAVAPAAPAAVRSRRWRAAPFMERMESRWRRRREQGMLTRASARPCST